MVHQSIQPKHDLQGREDIRALVDAFYDKVQADPLLFPVFTNAANFDWDHHLPVMYRFWETLLFRSGEYEGNPFLKHVDLPIDAEHFQCWLSLFLTTMDELYEGPKAEEAKLRAKSIAVVFQKRMGLMKSDGLLE